MNNKFMVGDLVLFKAGGPVMVVTTAPAQVANNNLVFAGVQQVWGIGNYTCTWWSENTQTFMQWNFHEDMLEDAPSN